MRTNNYIRLTASDLSVLWTSYVNDTMAVCGIRYFLQHMEDPEIKAVLEYALHLSEQHVKQLTNIFTEEKYPVPEGFTEKDVNLSAPRLFSDNLILFYILNMAKFGLNGYSIGLTFAERTDIVQYYSECLASVTELHNRSKKLIQEKGLYIRAPYLETSKGIDYVHQQSFLGGLFSEKRPLLAIEIANLVYNIKRNALGKAFIIGFSQVAMSEEVRKFAKRGRDIAEKHLEVFSDILDADYLPAPMIWDAEVTASQSPPFSDKLMMYHITALIASQLGQYGVSLSSSPRSDLAAVYVRLSAEIGHYANDGATIMIENGWMEKPPQSVNRKALAKA